MENCECAAFTVYRYSIRVKQFLCSHTNCTGGDDSCSRLVMQHVPIHSGQVGKYRDYRQGVFSVFSGLVKGASTQITSCKNTPDSDITKPMQICIADLYWIEWATARSYNTMQANIILFVLHPHTTECVQQVSQLQFMLLSCCYCCLSEASKVFVS